MKPVNRVLADEFHRHSEDGVEAVFARMFKVAGNHLGMSYAEVFDVSDNTIKTWRRRGAVSTKFLQGFGREYGVSLDYLMYGEKREDAENLALSSEERYFIDCYRLAPKQLRDAALRVLRGDEPPSSKPSVKVGGRSRVDQVAGRNIINTGRKNKK